MKWNVAAIVALLAVPAMSFAGVINLNSGGLTEIEVLPGGTFTVDVVLDLQGAAAVVGFDAQLRATGPTGDISWTARKWGGSADDGTGPAGDDGKTATKSPTAFPAVVPPPGTSPATQAGTRVAIGVLAGDQYPQADILPYIERLTLKLAANAAAYPYVLSLENANIIYGGTTATVPLEVGTSLKIIPEPASLFLLALGCLFLRRR